MTTSLRKVLITGGCGFIGSNLVIHMLKEHEDIEIVNLDLLTYAADPKNLAAVEQDSRYTFVKGNIASLDDVSQVMKGVECVVHLAAETHVDRSITDPAVFVRTNVLGTYNLLESARKEGVKRFVHISTDEVYGSLGPEGAFTETTSMAPNSPYSASKAGSDMLVRSYFKTFGFPAMITRCSNNYGPHQDKEKLLPLMISNACEDKSLPVYGDGMNVRDWLYVEDHCRAIDLVLYKGAAGEVYNIGGSNEWHNIDIVKLLLKKLGKPESLITFVEDRLGHDRRYAINSSKIRNELGWTPQMTFEQGLQLTIDWYTAG